MMNLKAYSSEGKEEDEISRRSDDTTLSVELVSTDEDQPSVAAYSTYTGYTKETVKTGTLTSSMSSGSTGSSLLVGPPPPPPAARRKPKLEPPSGFKTKSNMPPLDFRSAGLVGRDAEVSTLNACYARIMADGNTRKELVLVGGQSGVGKSSLVRSTIDSKISIEGIFVEGKFNMNTSNEPYSGVAKAFGVICDKIKEAGPETIAELRQDLRNELGSNTPGMLVQLIPELQGILTFEEPGAEVGSIDRVDETEGGVDRLRFAFRVLTRVFSALFSPLVLFLDDLQWADVSSLHVLEYLISDSENSNPIMIIGSYRSEEVDENSLLHIKMAALREKTEKFQYHMTELTIGSFSVNVVANIISTVVPSSSADHVAGLAALCHKRTLGNPFFTIEFLRMLHSERMLAFDEQAKTWSWSLSMIREETMSTANVVVMLEQQLRKLSEQVQALLQCAAYLGSSFNEPTIDLVWSMHGRRMVETRTSPVSSLLPGLVAGNIFEKGEKQQYRWAHDKLQEAALALSGARRDTFRLDIGKTLYYGLTKEQVEEDIFTIADLINNGNVLKLKEFAVVNLRAAEKAREVSAFQAVSEYASEGIGLLEETDWVQNKSTALSLYTIGAEAELILGNVDATERYREVVLSRSDLSKLEILPLQIGKAKALGDVELKSKEALEYCLKLLKNHGCRLTRVRTLSLPQAVVGLIRMVKKAKAKPQSFYETIEATEKKEIKFIGYLLSKAILTSYTAGDMGMYLLGTLKLVDITLEYGVNEFSASAFSFLGIMSVIVLKDYGAMERFVNVALGMLNKFQGMHAAESIFVGHQLGLFWTKPPEMSRGVLCSMSFFSRTQQDVQSIRFWKAALTYWLNSKRQSVSWRQRYDTWDLLRVSLLTISLSLSKYVAGVHILVTKNYYQMLLNLNDPSCESPSANVGNIFTDTKEDHKGNLILLSDMLVAEGELVFWHQDYEASAERALKVGETHAQLAPGIYVNQIESFHRAVALYAAAIKTKKGKYKRAGNKIRKRLSKLTQYENTTIKYYDMFLTAEHLALEKKHKEAGMKYEQALEAVEKLGHLHHLGLINERYSDYLQRELKSEQESRYRLEQALGYYRQWGAVRKVKDLESRLEINKS